MADIKASSNLEDNIEIPWAPMSYTISTMHCMTVSLAGGGTGLGSMWGRQLAISMLDSPTSRSAKSKLTPSTTLHRAQMMMRTAKQSSLCSLR